MESKGANAKCPNCKNPISKDNLIPIYTKEENENNTKKFKRCGNELKPHNNLIFQKDLKERELSQLKILQIMEGSHLSLLDLLDFSLCLE